MRSSRGSSATMGYPSQPSLPLRRAGCTAALVVHHPGRHSGLCCRLALCGETRTRYRGETGCAGDREPVGQALTGATLPAATSSGHKTASRAIPRRRRNARSRMLSRIPPRRPGRRWQSLPTGPAMVRATDASACRRTGRERESPLLDARSGRRRSTASRRKHRTNCRAFITQKRGCWLVPPRGRLLWAPPLVLLATGVHRDRGHDYRSAP
jgi:hypothetical protein